LPGRACGRQLQVTGNERGELTGYSLQQRALSRGHYCRTGLPPATATTLPHTGLPPAAARRSRSFAACTAGRLRHLGPGHLPPPAATPPFQAFVRSRVKRRGDISTSSLYPHRHPLATVRQAPTQLFKPHSQSRLLNRCITSRLSYWDCWICFSSSSLK
jgi:hypothetical protein